MKHLVILLSCIMLYNCAATVKVGVTIAPKYDFTMDEVGSIVEFTVDKLERPMAAGWTIVLVDGYIPIHNANEPNVIYLSDGAIVPSKKQILVFPWQSCLADSALIHELAHLIKYEHGKQKESVIANIHMLAVEALCPSNYDSDQRPPQPTIDDLTKEPIPRLWATQESDNG